MALKATGKFFGLLFQPVDFRFDFEHVPVVPRTVLSRPQHRTEFYEALPGLLEFVEHQLNFPILKLVVVSMTDRAHTVKKKGSGSMKRNRTPKGFVDETTARDRVGSP